MYRVGYCAAFIMELHLMGENDAGSTVRQGHTLVWRGFVDVTGRGTV